MTLYFRLWFTLLCLQKFFFISCQQNAWLRITESYLYIFAESVELTESLCGGQPRAVDSDFSTDSMCIREMPDFVKDDYDAVFDKYDVSKIVLHVRRCSNSKRVLLKNVKYCNVRRFLCSCNGAHSRHSQLLLKCTLLTMNSLWLVQTIMTVRVRLWY